ncbi:fasciclin domain-containing protein [Terrisporobacter sp.]
MPVSSVFAVENPSTNNSNAILDIASDNDELKTLVSAIEVAGLTDTLKGDGPFTIFAPSDRAFADLPEGTLENLLKPENNDNLQNILLYHVYNGKVTAQDATNLNGQEIDMANGKKAKMRVENGQVFINDAEIVTTDINAQNGVIHIIDTVLMPK